GRTRASAGPGTFRGATAIAGGGPTARPGRPATKSRHSHAGEPGAATRHRQFEQGHADARCSTGGDGPATRFAGRQAATDGPGRTAATGTGATARSDSRQATRPRPEQERPTRPKRGAQP